MRIGEPNDFWACYPTHHIKVITLWRVRWDVTRTEEKRTQNVGGGA
jgi:hypothetical protein